MPDSSGIVHDAASLLRFVETICKFCDLGKGYPAYLPASQDFLSFIQALSDSTRQYLLTFPSRMPGPSEYPVYRQELFTLREAWSEIHRRVKPIADADTLHVPSALINTLVRRLQTVDRFKGIRFAVLHTEWLNYLQVVASRIRSTANDISQLVGAPQFPKDLGLIGIPYSQSESVFLNCLIAHEIGHFAYGDLRLGDDIGRKAHAILSGVFTPIAGKLMSDDRKRIPTLFAGWAEELFCDLFAVRLIGPCYSYAFVEIFDLGNILFSDGTLNRVAAATSTAFSDSHPADLYRVRKQAELLRTLGWWPEISDSPSDARKVLEHSLGLSITDFSLSSVKNLQREMLDALEQITNDIVSAAENALSGIDSGVAEYVRLKAIVREYFMHGVVPSVVPDPSSGNRISPSAVTVLNVSYQLYLDGLSELLRRIENQDIASVAHRTDWTQRLEAWTLKALDDLDLMVISAAARA